MLPSALKAKVIDAMIAGEPCRKIAATIRKANTGLTVSHTQVAAYRRQIVKPAILTSQKVREMSEIQQSVSEVTRETANLTRAVVTADPILTRMEQRRLERERILGKAEKKEDFRGWAALDRNDLTATELEARLTGRLDSQPAAAQVAVIVLPTASLPGGLPAALPAAPRQLGPGEVVFPEERPEKQD
ncbi:MAG TPA: hypothetical protein VN442_23285 [Bryobacteraceae bacterium]|nr:hypothetical protein [Bryobacteraceae bacterium]